MSWLQLWCGWRCGRSRCQQRMCSIRHGVGGCNQIRHAAVGGIECLCGTASEAMHLVMWSQHDPGGTGDLVDGLIGHIRRGEHHVNSLITPCQLQACADAGRHQHRLIHRVV